MAVPGVPDWQKQWFGVAETLLEGAFSLYRQAQP